MYLEKIGFNCRPIDDFNGRPRSVVVVVDCVVVVVVCVVVVCVVVVVVVMVFVSFCSTTFIVNKLQGFLLTEHLP